MQILREILEHPDYLLLLFLRVSGLLIGSPIFGRKEVPGIAKVGFCMGTDKNCEYQRDRNVRRLEFGL